MVVGILEENQRIAQNVRETLEGAGHTVCAFYSIADMFHYEGRTIDLFILGCRSPRGILGSDVLRFLRQVHPLEIPVLFLIDRKDEQDLAQVLNAGLYDYALKPVRSGEVLARVNALFRYVSKEVGQGQTRHFVDYIFDVPTQTVFVKGQKVNLQIEDFKLALYLFENCEMCFSYEHLSQFITLSHKHDAIDVLLSTIARLRKVLDIRPSSMGFRLVTIYGFGYRLTSADSQI
jgi:DNA-binding response OmpR family regulator